MTPYAVIKNNLMATKYFFVKESRSGAGNKTLVLTRRISGRPVTVNLEFTKDGGVWLNPATYTFSSTISHFDYKESEQRWTRRKDIILGLVAVLQKASVWPFISNKKFFAINENCKALRRKKALKARVSDEMFDALQPRRRAKRDKAALKKLKKQADALLKEKKA